MHSRARRVLFGWPILLALAGTSVASASITPIVFRIEATNATGTGFFEVNFTDLVYNPATQVYSYTLPGAVDITTGGGASVAVLQSANLAFDDTPGAAIGQAPRIGMTWVAIAGDTLTTFAVRSGVVSFPPSDPATTTAKASAGFTATDNNGTGVNLRSLDYMNGLGMYTSYYNGGLSGTQYANLIAEVSTGPGGTGTASQSLPMSGFASLGVGVFDLAAKAEFTLTPGDGMSATTTYVVTPEPVALGIFLAGMLLLRRR